MVILKGLFEMINFFNFGNKVNSKGRECNLRLDKLTSSKFVKEANIMEI